MVNDFLDLAVFEIAEQDADSREEYEKGEEGTAERPENQATTNPADDGDDAPAGVAANFKFPLLL